MLSCHITLFMGALARTGTRVGVLFLRLHYAQLVLEHSRSTLGLGRGWKYTKYLRTDEFCPPLDMLNVTQEHHHGTGDNLVRMTNVQVDLSVFKDPDVTQAVMQM